MIVQLGARRLDLAYRAAIVGVVPTAGAVEPGPQRPLVALLDAAERLARDGADALLVGRPAASLTARAGAGPGGAASAGTGAVAVEGSSATAASPPPAGVVTVDAVESLLALISALCARIDRPVICATASAATLRAAVGAGAVAGDDASGFADPAYLATAAELGATVVAHAPEAGPGVLAALGARARWAESAGVGPGHLVLAASADLSGSDDVVAAELAGAAELAALGHPVCIAIPAAGPGSPANAGREIAAEAMAIAAGCRLVVTTDPGRARRVRDVMGAILEAGGS